MEIKIIDRKNFLKIIDNKSVDLFTLSNDNGMICQITNYGGRIVSLLTKDKYGNFDDVVLGYNSIDSYLNSNEKYYGAIIGRFANRISKGEFTIDNNKYHLVKNNNGNNLHGGEKGFNNVVWDVVKASCSELFLKYSSEDGEEGFPGKLEVEVSFNLNDEDELSITYYATTNKATPVNLTHHSYFNLLGESNGDIYNHILQINASCYTPIDDNQIPTGEIAKVENTAFDFRNPKSIGKEIKIKSKQLEYGNGYDHNFVLDGAGLKKAAIVFEKVTGRKMEVYTTEKGMQFYSGNFLDGTDVGKGNKAYKNCSAFCLETQSFPDSPNQKSFPSTILYPGKQYQSRTIYKFRTI